MGNVLFTQWFATRYETKNNRKTNQMQNHCDKLKPFKKIQKKSGHKVRYH